MNNKIKCPSCGIDISFDDFPAENKIECGVCGAIVELKVPEEEQTANAINVNVSTKPQIAGSESADNDSGTGNKKITNDAISSSPQKTFGIRPSCQNSKKKSVIDLSQRNISPFPKKGFPWIPVLASALVLVLILMWFVIIGMKEQRHVKADIPNATPAIAKNAQSANMPMPSTVQTTSLSKDSEKNNESDEKAAIAKKAEENKRKIEEAKLAEIEETEKAIKSKQKLEEERKSAFSTDIDEEKVKKILLAESRISPKAIEKGKDKSPNEINEEIKTEHKRLIDLNFPESMLEQVRQNANSKFNKDDMPTADVKFPQDMLKSITDEAHAKFKLVKVGDVVTMPKRQSAGYIDITGTYYGIFGDKILVKETKIFIADLPAEIRDLLTEEGVNKRTSAYITEKYRTPKENYEKQRRAELEKAKENIYGYIQANYLNPKLEYTKTSKSEVTDRLFNGYGFVFNNTKETWEYFGDYIKSKYSEFRNLKKEMSSLMNNSSDMQKTYEATYRVYNEETKSLSSLKSKSGNAPRIIRLSAFIIAMEKEDLYEIAMTEYSSYYERMVPTDKHAILVTETSEFTSKGHFSLDVVVLDSIPVKLKDESGGFNQKWTVYKEATSKDKKIFLELAEKENTVTLLKTRLDDSIQQKQKTDKRVQDIKNILAKYDAL